MKKILSFLIFTCVLFISCEKQNDSNAKLELSNSKQNWQSAKLDLNFKSSQNNVTSYLFSKNDLLNLTENTNIKKIRFVLGFENNKIALYATSVDSNNNELKSINSSVFSDVEFYSKIESLKFLKQNYSSSNTIINNHFITPLTAYNFITNWSNELKNKNSINEITSYNNVRIYHFSIEKEVIMEMLHWNNIKNISLFLGINEENKLTPILLGINNQNDFIIATSPNSSKTENSTDGGIFDRLDPCPTICDPIVD